MWIAVEGCCHGELDAIYATIAEAEKRRNIKARRFSALATPSHVTLVQVQLLLICGDFQAMRSADDLGSMACPDKWAPSCRARFPAA